MGVLSTYPPTHCGIARFGQSLLASLEEVAPDLSFQVVRLVDRPRRRRALDQVGIEIDPDSRAGRRAASEFLDGCDVVLINHEYGIFGANDGETLLEMVDAIDQPMVTIAHTVVADPSRRQEEIIQGLYQQTRLVVLSESARTALASSHSIPRSDVVVIPHGSGWSAAPPPTGPVRRLITWGLLGPGKGLEQAIHSMEALRDLIPQPRYEIVGRPHPSLGREGEAYRRRLVGLTRDLGVDDMVDFVDHYLEEDELRKLVEAAHIVVLPYRNEEQVTSGVLTDALAAGRPVVSTRFPHAVELISAGPGLLVGHDSEAMAQGLRTLMSDPVKYRLAQKAAAAKSPELSWRAGASLYARLIRSLVTDDPRHQALASRQNQEIRSSLALSAPASRR